PTTTQKLTDSVTIQGWYLSTAASTTLEIYVDGTKVENVNRSARADVLKAIKGYGDITTNPQPGYSATFNIEDYTYGEHQVEVKVKDNKGNEITRETRKFTKSKPATHINIDYPTTTQKLTDSVTIQGWYLSTAASTTLEIYVDGTKVENVNRSARADVLKAIKGYGDITTNPQPGYSATFNIEDYTYGEHQVEVKVKDNKGNEITKTTRKFTKSKPATAITIDYPTVSQKVTNTVTIQGWYLSTAASTSLEVYVDGNKIEEVNRSARADVLKAIKGYGDESTNPQPGYNKTVNIENYKYGEHQVEIKVKDNKGNEITKATRKFIKDKPSSFINIDYPSGKYKLTTTIQGWYLCKDKNTHAEIYVDNTKVTNITTSARPDVYKVYTNFGDETYTPKPGYSATFDSSTLSDGTHTVKVNIISEKNNDIISTKTKTFTVKKYDGYINIDYPQLANQSENFTLSGWEMSELDNSYLKLYIDNSLTSNTFTRSARSDVISAITNYGDASVNATPGFSTTVNVNSLSEGKHTLKLVLYSKLNEEITTTTKTIYVYKKIYNGIDVSQYNGSINWSSVKSAGVKYAIIRVAVRGYGTNAQGINGNLVKDTKFVSNVNGATNAGVKVGAYVFSQAISEQEAIQEANIAITTIQNNSLGSKIKLPIVFDSEFSGCVENGKRCGRADGLSKAKRTAIAKAFLNTVKLYGYKPMIYASTSFLNNQLDMSQLNQYDVWVAHYGVSKPTYKGHYQMWQYTSTGSVKGISGNVDMDYVYKNY
ncbi:MAG: glycoside hydrolase family 25 protein, partial [Bacilli bacterium]|nr:glycoside hydrolase family 25 protein [Bacilli bacterium]